MKYPTSAFENHGSKIGGKEGVLKNTIEHFYFSIS